jgi:hypothetical protein
MHGAGVGQSRHYTRKNMYIGGGGGFVFVLPRIRGKGAEGKSGCSYFVWGFTRKQLKFDYSLLKLVTKNSERRILKMFIGIFYILMLSPFYVRSLRYKPEGRGFVSR